MIRRILKLKTIIVISFILFFSVVVTSVLGKDTVSESEGVTMWPTLHVINIRAGESKDITVHIKNHNDLELEVTAEYKNLRVSSNPLEGLSIEGGLNVAPASWLSPKSPIPFELSPGEENTFISMLSIPEDIDVKGHYPVILMKFTSKEITDEFRATSEIGSVLYISVSDVKGKEAKVDSQVKYFSANPKISLKPRATFSTAISNSGNVHYRPRGKMNIINPKGIIQSDTPSFNERLRYLLPGQTLEEELVWKDNDSSLFPPIGKYRAVFDLYIEEDRSFILREETYFYVVPYQYFFLVGVVLLVIFGGIYMVKRRAA